MDYFGRLSSKNTFGMFNTNPISDVSKRNINIINIICGILLIILIIVLIVSLVNNNNDNFSNNSEHMFLIVRDGCGYANKALELFKQNGMMINGVPVKVIDISEAKKYIGNLSSQVQGTPTVVCTKTNKISVGHKSIEEHAKELGMNKSDHSDHSNQSNIILIGRNSCPFCVKAKSLLDKVLGNNNYKFIDSNSSEGTSYLQKHEMNGVPLTINLKNGKVVKGYNENELRTIHQ